MCFCCRWFVLVHLWLFLSSSSINTFSFFSLPSFQVLSLGENHVYWAWWPTKTVYACLPVCVCERHKERVLRNVVDSPKTVQACTHGLFMGHMHGHRTPWCQALEDTLKDTNIYEQKQTQTYIRMFLHTNTQWFCQGHSLLDLTLYAGVPAL